MLKKCLTTTLLVLAVLTGLGLLLYPTVSDYVNSLGYRKTIANYNQTVESMDTETYDRILSAAQEYNARLASRTLSPLSLSPEDRAIYEQMLDITGTGVMGYIVIPSVSISLPIYHGTGEAVLQSGVGHLEGSSLPIGGENTHTILSGHRGLPSSKLFTNIDKLSEGDTFTIRVLNEVLTYEVDQIETVEPYMLNYLEIEEGMDYCTLVTCTPYGVNTHRLLVRGHRVETKEEDKQAVYSSGSFTVLDNGFDMMMLIPVAVAGLALLVILLLARHYRRRPRRPRRPGGGGDSSGGTDAPDGTDSPGGTDAPDGADAPSEADSSGGEDSPPSSPQ